MPDPKSGTAFDPNFPGAAAALIWDIVDTAGIAICQFSHVVFPNIMHGTPVFFVDDLAPFGIAENVWPKSAVDALAASAVPANGATPAALRNLRAHVMTKLAADQLHIVSGAPSIMPAIEGNLAAIKASLDGTVSRRATVASLALLGV